jgi:signal transduction histidine kinase
VSVKCIATEDALELVIADNGKGMPQGAERDHHSLGLLGMRERAGLLGGKVTFAPGDSGGTRVMATLPRRKAP